MKDVYPKQMEIEYDTEYKTILTMYDEKGNKRNQMIIYHVFNGLDLTYNKFNTFKCPEPSENTENEIIEINYCKRGVYECVVEKERNLYLTEGDMAANMNTIKRKISNMPTGCYEGISFLIDVDKLNKHIPSMFLEIIDNMKHLKEVLKKNELGIVLKPIKEMIHIFDELYVINPDKNIMHTKLKILELLVVFTAIPLEDRNRQKKYLDKVQIDKIKKIHEEITSNLDKRITIEILSKKYAIGTTTLKVCFKEIYGQPVYTYLKDYKIHTSLHLLEETDKNINEIAGMLGYDNSSKFAKVFKEKMGCTPIEYRKQKVHLEHERLFGVEIE